VHIIFIVTIIIVVVIVVVVVVVDTYTFSPPNSTARSIERPRAASQCHGARATD